MSAIPDNIKIGLYPAARIYCVPVAFGSNFLHFPLTSKSIDTEGAVSTLCYGFNVEESAPTHTITNVGYDDNGKVTALHNYIYWLHGYEHLDTLFEKQNPVKMDVKKMCLNVAKEIGCDIKCPVTFTRNDHNNLIDYLCSDKVFSVEKNDYIIYIACTNFNLMYLYHGCLKIAPKTVSTVNISEHTSAFSVDLFNGVVLDEKFDETLDPIDIQKDLDTDINWVKSDILTDTIHTSYVLSMASTFNMLNDINGCRRLLLLCGQVSTFKNRITQLDNCRDRDLVGNNKQSIANDMIDRVALSTYLALIESCNEIGPMAYYKNWSISNIADDEEYMCMAIQQKAILAPALFALFADINSVGVGFQCVLKTQSELDNEKNVIDKMTIGTEEKERKKKTKDLNYFKIISGPNTKLNLAKRLIIFCGFSPHIFKWSIEILEYLNNRPTSSIDVEYRSSQCKECCGSDPACVCISLPVNVSKKVRVSAYSKKGNFTGIALGVNKIQTFGDLEQPPYNNKVSEEDKIKIRKTKQSLLVQEGLAKLSSESKHLLDDLFEDRCGSVMSLSTRAKVFKNDIKKRILNDKRMCKQDKKDTMHFSNIISVLTELYNIIFEQVKKYEQAIDEHLDKKGNSSPKHNIQSSTLLQNYAAYGPGIALAVTRTIAFCAYVTVKTYISKEIFSNPTKSINDLLSDNQLFNPRLQNITQNYMTKNQSIRVSEESELSCNMLHIQPDGTCCEKSPRYPPHFVTCKPIAFKQVLFKSLSGDGESKHGGGSFTLKQNRFNLNLPLLNDDIVFQDNDADFDAIKEFIDHNSNIDVSSTMKVDSVTELKKYLPLFKDYTSEFSLSFFRYLFHRENTDLRLAINKAQGSIHGMGLYSMIDYCIDNNIISNRTELQCIAKYISLIGKGRESLNFGKLPLNISDLAYCIFENLVIQIIKPNNMKFPLDCMHKLMALISKTDMDRGYLSSKLHATLSSGFGLQTNPLLVGNLSYFSFFSNIGVIIRMGLMGIDTQILNELQNYNVDTTKGLASNTNMHFIVVPNTSNFIPDYVESNKGLRQKEIEKIEELLQVAYDEDTILNTIKLLLKNTKYESVDQCTRHLFSLLETNCCDVFDFETIIEKVLATQDIELYNNKRVSSDCMMGNDNKRAKFDV